MRTFLLAACTAISLTATAHAQGPSCAAIAIDATKHGPQIAAHFKMEVHKALATALDEDYRVWAQHGNSLYDWSGCPGGIPHVDTTEAQAKPGYFNPRTGRYDAAAPYPKPTRTWQEITNGRLYYCSETDFPKSGIVNTECH